MSECEFCEIDGLGNHAPRCPVMLEAQIDKLEKLVDSLQRQLIYVSDQRDALRKYEYDF